MSIVFHNTLYTLTCNETSLTDDPSLHVRHFESIMTHELHMLMDYSQARLEELLYKYKYEDFIDFSTINKYLLSNSVIFDKIVGCTNFLYEYKKLFIPKDSKINDDIEQEKIFRKFSSIIASINKSFIKVLILHGKIPNKVGKLWVCSGYDQIFFEK